MAQVHGGLFWGMKREGAFGADVSYDSARRNVRPEISCQDGNYAPVRLWQMKWPCIRTPLK